MTAVDVDALDAARAAEDETLPWRLDPHDSHHVQDRHGNGVTNTFLADDAALIVAAVNSLPALIAAARERDALRDAMEGLAEELEREADERDQIASRLPNAPSYRMEINRLVVAAAHQRRASRRLRSLLAAVDGGEGA